MVFRTPLYLLAAILFAAGVPESAAPVRPVPVDKTAMRHFLVQVRILEVDEQGRQTLLAEPVLQTRGAAAGVTVEEETGRRFEFHFSAAEPGAPAPLPLPVADDSSSPKPISAAVAAAPPLQQKISVKAVQQPRKDVLRDIARQAGLTVALEPEAAAESAYKLAAPVTFQIDNAPLNEVLAHLVEPLQLDYAVRHDLVLIGFRKGDEPSPIRGPEPLPLKPTEDWQIRVYGVADLVGKDEATGRPNFDPLLARLRKEVLPDSWNDQGEAGTVRGFDSTVSLVVRQTSVGHAAVAQFLDQLRRQK